MRIHALPEVSRDSHGWELLGHRTFVEVTDVSSVLARISFKSLFRVCPEAQVLFGFPLDMYPDPRELLGSHRFSMHAMFLMEMIDSTISIMGKDNDKLAETLTNLGRKHATYGVKPEMFPFMTDSIIHMMKHHLDSDQFTTDDEKAWKLVFGALIEDIVEAQNQLAMEAAVKDKAAVVESWTKFTKQKNYETEGGVILFQQ